MEKEEILMQRPGDTLAGATEPEEDEQLMHQRKQAAQSIQWCYQTMLLSSVVDVAIDLYLANPSSEQDPSQSREDYLLSIWTNGVWLLDTAWKVALGVYLRNVFRDYTVVNLKDPLSRVRAVEGLMSMAVLWRRTAIMVLWNSFFEFSLAYFAPRALTAACLAALIFGLWLRAKQAAIVQESFAYIRRTSLTKPNVNFDKTDPLVDIGKTTCFNINLCAYAFSFQTLSLVGIVVVDGLGDLMKNDNPDDRDDVLSLSSAWWYTALLIAEIPTPWTIAQLLWQLHAVLDRTIQANSAHRGQPLQVSASFFAAQAKLYGEIQATLWSNMTAKIAILCLDFVLEYSLTHGIVAVIW